MNKNVFRYLAPGPHNVWRSPKKYLYFFAHQPLKIIVTGSQKIGSYNFFLECVQSVKVLYCGVTVQCLDTQYIFYSFSAYIIFSPGIHIYIWYIIILLYMYLYGQYTRARSSPPASLRRGHLFRSCKTVHCTKRNIIAYTTYIYIYIRIENTVYYIM